MATLRNKLGLLRGLLAGDGVARTGPFFVTIDPTRRCNLKCVGCRYHSPNFRQPSPGFQETLDISRELVDRLLVDLADLGTNGVVFVGEGEPFLHPHLIQMMSRAKQLGFWVAVISNGTLIDREVAEEIVRAQVDRVTVSFWAVTPETHVLHLNGEPERSFWRSVEGVKAVSDAKRSAGGVFPAVRISIPLTRHNFDELHLAADLVSECGCEEVVVGPLRKHRGQLEAMALSEAQEKMIRTRVSQLGRRLERQGIRHNLRHVSARFQVGEMPYYVMPCYVGWFHARVKVDGTVLPCNACDLIMGNLLEQEFSDLWNGRRFRQFRRGVLTRNGLADVAGDCDCGFCCHLDQNKDVYRYARWFAAWSALKLRFYGVHRQ